MNLEELWSLYHESNDVESRQHLILHYLPLVRRAVARCLVSLPPDLEYDDLVSYGIVGLINAVERFDPQRETRFESYARVRIMGSVIDALRSIGQVPRSVRDKAKKAAERSLQEDPHQGLEIPEGRGALRPSQATSSLSQAVVSANRAILSLDSPLSPENSGEELSLGDILEDNSFPSPAVQAEDSEVQEALHRAIGELREKERLVIQLYYYDGLTMKEIGKVLGLSEARVSQIHAKALPIIRTHLIAMYGPPPGQVASSSGGEETGADVKLGANGAQPHSDDTRADCNDEMHRV